jgi:hypothetical protein
MNRREFLNRSTAVALAVGSGSKAFIPHVLAESSWAPPPQWPRVWCQWHMPMMVEVRSAFLRRAAGFSV